MRDNKDKYTYVSRKIFDKTVDTLKRRIIDKADEIKAVRKRMAICEEALRRLIIEAGCPDGLAEQFKAFKILKPE